MEFDQKRVHEVVGTEEYKAVCKAYLKKFGVIKPRHIPEGELFGDFKRKVEESIACGYDLLAKSYNLTSLFDWVHTKEFRELQGRYSAAFPGGTFPLMMMGGTFQELVSLVDRSIEDSVDYLPGHFGWGNKDRIY